MNKQIILVPGGRRGLRKIYEDLTSKHFNETNRYSNTVFIADNDDTSASSQKLVAMHWSTDSTYFPVGSDSMPIPGVKGVWSIVFANSIDEIVQRTGCSIPKIV